MPNVTLSVHPDALPVIEQLVASNEGVAYAKLSPLERATHIADVLIADGDFAPSERDRLIEEYTEAYEEVQDHLDGKRKLKSTRLMLSELRDRQC